MGRRRGVQFMMGSFYRTDDRSGFVNRAENTKQEWNELIVSKKLWEPRQPQDFVKGVADNQFVPDSRSENPALWQGPLNYQLVNDYAVGATFLALNYTAGISADDKVGVMLDTGAYFNTSVVGSPSGGGITIAAPLPDTASMGNIVTDYESPGP